MISKANHTQGFRRVRESAGPVTVEALILPWPAFVNIVQIPWSINQTGLILILNHDIPGGQGRQENSSDRRWAAKSYLFER